jgi:hypothetical protein
VATLPVSGTVRTGHGASGQVRDDPVFHPLGRGAERVADRFAEQVLGDGAVVDGGESLGSGPDGGGPAPFGGVSHDGDQGGVTVGRLLGGQLDGGAGVS